MQVVMFGAVCDRCWWTFTTEVWPVTLCPLCESDGTGGVWRYTGQFSDAEIVKRAGEMKRRLKTGRTGRWPS